MPVKPVIIIGAGLSGLTLGRALHQKGISAILFERMTCSPRNNHGIVLRSPAIRSLLSILQIEEPAFREKTAILGTNDSFPVLSNSLYFHRGRLELLLREGLNIQWGHQVQDFEISHTSQRWTAVFENGERVQSDHFVGCDGPHSLTRQLFAPSMKLRSLPYAVFNGKRYLTQEEYSNITRPTKNESVLVQTPNGKVRLQISIDNCTVSAVDVGYTYSRPAKNGFDPLYKPNRSIRDANLIPKEFYEELRELQGLDAVFSNIFDPEKVQHDRVLHWQMRSVMPDSHEIQTLADQGIVLIGDAAHAMPILGGEGANVAIQDAVDLAEHIFLDGWENLRSFSISKLDSWKRSIEDSEGRLKDMVTAQG